MRRVLMFLLLLVLSALILGYNYVTDSNRVRAMAENYLSRLIGGKVAVGSATLSIFEGLRLDQVKVYVDDGRQPDSLVFSAQSFVLKYDPAKIIRGQLEAGQIIAQKPHVYLTHDVLTHAWNFHRLGEKARRRPKVAPPPQQAKPPPLPEVMLRNARVEIRELRDGQVKELGFEALDGHLSPMPEPGRFSFDLQTRGIEGVGPWAHGTASVAGGPLDAELHDFNLGRDVRSMLWADLRAFWERHGFEGRLDTLRVHYQPPSFGRKETFWARMLLKGVNLSVPPEDWLSAADVRRRRHIREAVALMRSTYTLAGEGSRATGDSSRTDPQAQDAPVESPLADRLRMDPRSPADAIASATQSAPIQLRQGSGAFVFTEQGVQVQDVTGRVEGNPFVINGSLAGYNPDAPFSLQVRSVANETLSIPSSPPYLNALPSIIHDIYSMIEPDGKCRLSLSVDRPTPGSRPLIQGQVDVVDGTFSTIFFRYKLRQIHGQVRFGYNAQAKADFVHVIHMRGRGMPDGPNRDHWIEVNGDIGPLGPEHPDPQIVLHVTGDSISSEPALLKAFPPEVRKPLQIFDAHHSGRYPIFHGGFSSTVLHREGWAKRWTFDTDVDLDDATGRLQGFEYPLDHVATTLHVRDGYVDIINARMNRGGARMRVDGRVTWDEHPEQPHQKEQPVKTDIRVSLKDFPIDDALLAAMPRDQSAWITRLGLAGKIDVNGRIFQGLDGPPESLANDHVARADDDLKFDLGITLHDGTLWPRAGTFSISNLFGRLHLTRDEMRIDELHGRRNGGELSGHGLITWADGPPVLAFALAAKSLPLDASLYSILPPGARGAWDEVEPRGALDAELSYRGIVGKTNAAASGGKRDDGFAPEIPEGFHAVLKPKGMTVSIQSMKYELRQLGGTVIIAPDKVTIQDVTGQHGRGTISVSGTGTTGDHPVWTLALAGKNVAIDDDLRKALPASMLAVLDAIKLRGTVDFKFPRFVYEGEGLLAASPGPATRPHPAAAPPSTKVALRPPASGPALVASTRASGPTAAAQAASPIQIDLASTIDLHRCSLDVGVPVEQVDGQIRMAATVRNGQLAALRGDLDLANVTMGGRHLTDFHAQMHKAADQSDLYFDKMQGQLAGGNVAGQVHLSFPDAGPSKYVMSFVVRNANLQTLVADAEKDIKGELTANLSLEGSWSDPNVRRGRGEVVVSGKELYHIPLVMGLLQMTNLTLPIATPFKNGSARYSVEGQRINFEQIELKSDNMMMLGTGFMNFKNKQVRMTFTTDSPGGFKIPFLNDLWQGARGELLKISIKGTIQAPKVQANPFGTFTTTIDEVFKDDGKKAVGGRR